MPRLIHASWTSEAVGFPTVGKNAKALRLKRGISIRQLAAEALVSKNTILRLESGLPVSERVLSSICASLDTTLPTLSASTVEPVRVRVFRKDESQWLSVHQRPEARGHLPKYTPVPDSAERERYGRLGFMGGFLMTHSCTLPDGNLLAAVYEVHHRWSIPMHHAGEEFVYCLRGQVRVSVGEDAYDLDEGDSISFDSSQHHYFERVTPPPSLAPQILSVWIEGETLTD